jgi:hypothetical protein
LTTGAQRLSSPRVSIHPFSDPEVAKAVGHREPAIPGGVATYARIEGLLGEEAGLLSLAREERREEHRERLGEITEELDQIWERLRERAERLGDRRHLRSET